jgi:hypothetical protein
MLHHKGMGIRVNATSSQNTMKEISKLHSLVTLTPMKRTGVPRVIPNVTLNSTHSENINTATSPLFITLQTKQADKLLPCSKIRLTYHCCSFLLKQHIHSFSCRSFYTLMSKRLHNCFSIVCVIVMFSYLYN